jgi:CheY-specific phosphatase CheX
MALRPSSELLAEVTSEILEECAFVMVAPPVRTSLVPRDVVYASIELGGDVGGSLRVTVARSLGIEVAANMLAVEPDDEDAVLGGEDAVAELVNIMAGALAERLVGTDVVCPLGIPTVHSRHPPAWSGPTLAAVALEDMDGRPVRVEFLPSVAKDRSLP